MIEQLADLCHVVWILDERIRPHTTTPRRLLERFGSVHSWSNPSAADLVQELQGSSALDGIVATDDTTLDLAARLADRLDLRFHSPAVVERLTDKTAQRAALRRAGMPGPDSVVLPGGSSPRRGLELAATVAFPAVLKPRRGASSRHTYRIGDLADLDALLGGDRLLDGDTGDFVLESFLPAAAGLSPAFAAFVSVESLVVDGAISHIGITGKFPLAEPFREGGHFVPAVLPADTADAVVDVAGRAATAIGVRHGVLHTEIQLTHLGPVVIEVNGRVGGGSIPRLYANRHGVSLRLLAARAALGLTAGPPPDLASGPPYSYAFLLQAPQQAGRVERVAGLDRLAAQPGVGHIEAHHAPGDALDWRLGTFEYVVSVEGTAPDLPSLEAVPTVVDSMVDVTYG